MINQRRLLCLLTVVVACGKTDANGPPQTPSPNGTASAAPSSSASDSAAPSTSAAPSGAASDALALENKAEKRFSIMLPKGAKEFHRSAIGSLTQIDYTFPLDPSGDDALEAHVNIGENAGESSLDAAVRRATMAGGKVQSKTEVGPGTFLVVMEEEGMGSRQVFFFTKGGMVKCNGPSKYTATLTAVCQSLKVR